MSTVLTVILNWRTAEMTLRSAEAALVAMEGVDGAIVIVDNDSGDGSFERMSAEVASRGWTRVRVIQSAWNGGFGAGNNVGIRAGLPGGVRPDYIWLLNSDAFPEPGAIRALRDHLDRCPGTGFAGSTIHGEDGAPHLTAFRFPSAIAEFTGQVRFGPLSRLFAGRQVVLPMPEVTGPVDWLAGASLMMRDTVLQEIGLFDETFFLYFEETDLCRGAALAGWATDYVVESRVMHIGSVSTGMGRWKRVPGFWLDSRWHYFRKNHGRIGAFLATLALVSGGVIWRARMWLERKAPQDPPHFLADLIRHHLGRALGRAPARNNAIRPLPGVPEGQKT